VEIEALTAKGATILAKIPLFIRAPGCGLGRECWEPWQNPTACYTHSTGGAQLGWRKT